MAPLRTTSSGATSLLRIETISQAEAYAKTLDGDSVTQYNKQVALWADQTTAELKAMIAPVSASVSSALKHRFLRDKQYRTIRRISFQFPRHGIYIHKGASRSHRGQGSQWELLRRTTSGVWVGTGTMRTTDMRKSGWMNTSSRSAFPWFDRVMQHNLSALADLVARHWDTKQLDTSQMFVDR